MRRASRFTEQSVPSGKHRSAWPTHWLPGFVSQAEKSWFHHHCLKNFKLDKVNIYIQKYILKWKKYLPDILRIYLMVNMKKYYIYRSLAGYSVSIYMWLCLNIYWTDFLDCYRNPGSFSATNTSQVNTQVNAFNIGLRFPSASLEMFNSQQRNLSRVKCLTLRDTADKSSTCCSPATLLWADLALPLHSLRKRCT